MADVREYIDYEDTLREGTDKLNDAIDRAYDADETSTQAKQDVDGALIDVDDTLGEINTVKDTVNTALDEVGTAITTVNTLSNEVQEATDDLAQAFPVGDYDASTTYYKNNEVSYNGSSYVAKQETTGNAPTNTTYWQLRAQPGVDGEGSVSSVNGISPDLDGNVVIEIPDVSGLATKVEVQTVESELNTHLAEKATLTQEGHVQLSNAINSTSNSLAATPSAVKQAYDRADEAFMLGNSTKEDLVDKLLLLDDSLPIDYNSTWQDVLSSISQISTGKKWASGEVISSSDQIRFTLSDGAAYNRPYINVAGLGFTPTTIVVHRTMPIGAFGFIVFKRDYFDYNANNFGSISDGTRNYRLDENAYVGNDFQIPVTSASVSWDWVAFE